MNFIPEFNSHLRLFATLYMVKVQNHKNWSLTPNFIKKIWRVEISVTNILHIKKLYSDLDFKDPTVGLKKLNCLSSTMNWMFQEFNKLITKGSHTLNYEEKTVQHFSCILLNEARCRVCSRTKPGKLITLFFLSAYIVIL